MSVRSGGSFLTRRGPRRVLSCIALFSMVVSLTIANGALVLADEGDPTQTNHRAQNRARARNPVQAQSRVLHRPSPSPDPIDIAGFHDIA